MSYKEVKEMVNLLRNEINEIKTALQFILTAIKEEENEERKLEMLGLKETIKKKVYAIGTPNRGKAFSIYLPKAYLRVIGVDLDKPEIYVKMTLNRIFNRIEIRKNDK